MVCHLVYASSAHLKQEASMFVFLSHIFSCLNLKYCNLMKTKIYAHRTLFHLKDLAIIFELRAQASSTRALTYLLYPFARTVSAVLRGAKLK